MSRPQRPAGTHSPTSKATRGLWGPTPGEGALVQGAAAGGWTLTGPGTDAGPHWPLALASSAPRGRSPCQAPGRPAAPLTALPAPAGVRQASWPRPVALPSPAAPRAPSSASPPRGPRTSLPSSWWRGGAGEHRTRYCVASANGRQGQRPGWGRGTGGGDTSGTQHRAESMCTHGGPGPCRPRVGLSGDGGGRVGAPTDHPTLPPESFPVDSSGETWPPCGFPGKTACPEGGVLGPRVRNPTEEPHGERSRNGESTLTAADRGVPGAEGPWGQGQQLGGPGFSPVRSCSTPNCGQRGQDPRPLSLTPHGRVVATWELRLKKAFKGITAAREGRRSAAGASSSEEATEGREGPVTGHTAGGLRPGQTLHHPCWRGLQGEATGVTPEP